MGSRRQPVRSRPAACPRTLAVRASSGPRRGAEGWTSACTSRCSPGTSRGTTSRSLIEYVRTAERLGFTAVSVNDHLQFRRPWLDGADRARVGARGDGRDDGRDDDHARRRPRSDPAREVARRDRPAVRRPPGGRRGAGLVPPRLRGRRDRLGRALAEVRGGDPGPPGALAPRRRPVRGRASTPRATSASSPSRRSPAARRSGSGAGARTPGSGAWPGSATGGSPRPTTRPRRGSRQAWAAAARAAPAATARTPRRSRTPSPRCGSASRTTRRRPVAPSRSGWPRRSAATRTSSSTGCSSRSAEVCAERLSRYAEAGVRRVFLWPVGEPVEQLERFGEQVVPLLQSLIRRTTLDAVDPRAIS